MHGGLDMVQACTDMATRIQAAPMTRRKKHAKKDAEAACSQG